jgi:peptidyl-prolyl cis-trans isomerase B (cyclophilin B)
MGTTRFGRAAALAAVLGVVGCGQKSDPPAGESRGQPTVSIPSGDAAPTTSAADEARRLHQPFAEAVSEESPGNQQPPPDATLTGVPTGKVRVEVQKLWDSIRFTDAAGKPLAYYATFETEHGSFRVWLRHDLAPNHVRNFVALARAGYYNGLVFEHVIEQQGDDGPDSKLELVEGGCPVGTGEPGVGHLGYWLHPEFSDTFKHEPGTFGAFHDDSPASAACRFYVALTKAPAMDGNFTAYGQVVAGLEVVRTIAKQPKTEGGLQPVKPVTIRSVTIETQEVR